MSPVVVIWLVLLVGGFYILIMRPRRMQAQKAAALRKGLEPGDSVVTIGGIYGIVDSTEGDDVLLEISEGVVIRVAARAIATTLHHEEDEEEDEPHEDEHEDVEAEADEDVEDVEEPLDEPAEQRSEG